MKEDYFVYSEKKYHSGTIMKIYSGPGLAKNVVFLFCVPDKNWIVYRELTNGNKTTCDKANFEKNYLIEVTDKIVSLNSYDLRMFDAERIEDLTFKEEVNVDGMLNAWLWYIVIMLVSVVLVDRILAWIFATVVFFNYRSNKLKERGYK